MFDTKLPITSIRDSADLSVARLKESLAELGVLSESSLLLSLYRELVTLRNGVGNPVTQTRDILPGALMFKEDISQPLSQSVADISVLRRSLSSLRSYSLSAFNIMLSEVAGLDQLAGQARSSLSSFRVQTSNVTNEFVWVSDSFNSREKVDGISSVNVDTRGGFISLQILAEEPMAKYLSSVAIDKDLARSTKAIPGNNSEIRDFEAASVQNRLADVSPEPAPTLYGQVSATDDVTNVFDGDPGTCFELESCWAPTPQRVGLVRTAFVSNGGGDRRFLYTETQKYGWKVNVQWPGETSLDTNNGAGYWLINLYGFDVYQIVADIFGKQKSEARVAAGSSPDYSGISLGMTVELDQPRAVSLISLTPYIRESKYPRLDSLEVSQDGKTWKRVEQGLVLSPEVGENDFQQFGGIPIKNDAGTKFWNVSEPYVKYVRLRMSQPESYKCYLGHKYYVQPMSVTKTTNILVFSSTKHRDEFQRLPDPSYMVVGTSKVAGTSSLGGIWMLAGGSALGGALVGSLYNVSTTKEPVGSVEEHYDIFLGLRYSVGIRDFTILQHEYAQTSQLTSRDLRFASPVQAVSLIATENIPPSWGDGDWVRYEINTGGDWREVCPLNRQNRGSAPTALVTQPTTSVRVRITMTRPSDRLNETPLVLSYAVKGDLVR